MTYRVCKRGHSRSPENTAKDGSCKICKNMMRQKIRASNKINRPKITHCKNGHPRTPDNVYAGNGGCKECCRASSKKSKAENPERYAGYYKKWAELNKEKVKQASIKWHSNEENKAKKKVWQKEYLEKYAERRKLSSFNYSEKNKEKISSYRKKWEKENRPKCRAAVRKRQAAKLQRTPPWLTKQQLQDIEAFYSHAVALGTKTGVMHHVDHIVPLRGKIVSGLHVPWNLQVITAVENSKKHNSLVGWGAEGLPE